MGTLKGIIRFTGHFDGLSFYEMNGKIIVRKTGGFDGERILKDPQYERVRENSNEFAHCAEMGKYFRSSLQPYLKSLHIPYVHNRVLGLFQEISRLDMVSLRGQRTIFNGLQSENAKRIILQFEFDKNQPFATIFPFTYKVDWLEGNLKVFNFSSLVLKEVPGATHIRLHFVVVGLDFEHQSPFVKNSSDVITMSLQDAMEADLEISCVIPSSPFVFGLLYLEYFQRMSDLDYDLQGGGLKIVGFR